MPNDKSPNGGANHFRDGGNGEPLHWGTIALVAAAIVAAYLLGMATTYVCFIMPHF